MNKILLSLALLAMGIASTAFGKTFRLFNNSNAPVWAYTYCTEEDAESGNFRTEDLLENGKQDFHVSDSIFLCNPIVKVGLATKKGNPTLFLNRGMKYDEVFDIRSTWNGGLSIASRRQNL